MYFLYLCTQYPKLHQLSLNENVTVIWLTEKSMNENPWESETDFLLKIQQHILQVQKAISQNFEVGHNRYESETKYSWVLAENRNFACFKKWREETSWTALAKDLLVYWGEYKHGRCLRYIASCWSKRLSTLLVLDCLVSYQRTRILAKSDERAGDCHNFPLTVHSVTVNHPVYHLSSSLTTPSPLTWHYSEHF